MIVGIGVDILDSDRILKLADNEKFIDRYFTDDEKMILRKKKKSIASNFTAKEAVAKAFGTGIDGFSLKDIEILRDEKGKPFVNLYNSAKQIAKNLNIDVIHVSISDTDTQTIAYVVVENRECKI